MATPTETYYNIRKLNRIFAVIALAGLASICWLVARNYTQPWRTQQRDAQSWDRFLLRQEIELRRSDADRNIAEAQDEVDRAQEILDDFEAVAADLTAAEVEKFAGLGDEYYRLKDELKALKAESDDIQREIGFVKANRDKFNQDIEQARQMNPAAVPDLIRAREQSDRMLDEYLRKQYENNNQIAEHGDDIKAIEDTVGLTAARKKLSDAQRDWNALNEQLAALDPNLSFELRSAPLMDFLAPTQAPKQVFLADIYQDLVFAKVPTTDRCMTCHVNIDNPRYERPQMIADMTFYLSRIGQADLLYEVQDPATWDPAPPPSQVKTLQQWFYYDLLSACPPDAGPDLRAMWQELIDESVFQGYQQAWEEIGPQFDEAAAGAIIAALTARKIDPETGGASEAGGKVSIWSAKDRLAVGQSLASKGDALQSWTWLVQTAVQHGFAQAVPSVLRGVRYTQDQRDRFARLLYEMQVLDYDVAPPTGIPAGVAPEQAYLMTLLESVNKQRKIDKLDPLDWSNALLAHPHLEQYVGPDSPHPLNSMGCTVCHEGSGGDLDFTLSAHTPDSSLQRAVWSSKDWSEVGEKLGYLDPAARDRQVRVAKLNGWQPHDWEVNHFWDRPMLPATYVQAACAKCHTGIYDIQSAAPRLAEGRKLFSEIGCANCHAVSGLENDSRRVGPDLAHIAEKTTPEWTADWIRDPRGFRPSTRMPHFFRRPNNSDPDNLWRTEIEIDSVADYLFDRSMPSQSEKPPAGLAGDARHGRDLFNSVGCLACHSNLADNGGEWIAQAMVDRKHGYVPPADDAQRDAWQQAVDADYAKAKAQAAAMSYDQQVAWMLSNTPERTSRFAPELSRVGMKTTAAWLYGWLRDPKHYSSTTKMPSLRLGQQEAMDLATYLAGLKLDPQEYAQSVSDKLAAAYLEKRHPTAHVESLDMNKLLATAGRQRLAALADQLKSDQPPTPTEIKYALMDEIDRVVVELLASKSSKPVAIDEQVWTLPNLEDWDALLHPEEGPAVDLSKATVESLRQKVRELSAEDGENAGLVESQRLNALRRALVEELVPYWAAENAPAARRKAQADLMDRFKVQPDDKQVRYTPGLLTGYRRQTRQAERLFVGVKAINNYGCFGCHNVPGFEAATRIGTDLSDWGDKNLHKVDFAYFDPVYEGRVPSAMLAPGTDEQYQPAWSRIDDPPQRVRHEKLDWLFWKLHSPRMWDRGKSAKGPYELLKMPQFGLTRDEIEAIQTFIISRRDPLVAPSLQQTGSPEIPRGRQLVRTFNCIACHRVDDNMPLVAHTFRFNQDQPLPFRFWIDRLSTQAPPLLIGEGAKVQPQWLVGFFGDVIPLRPALKIRMPSFNLTPQEKSDLAQFFRATVDKAHRELAAVVLDKDGNPVRELTPADLAKVRRIFNVSDNQLPSADLLDGPAARLVRGTLPKVSDAQFMTAMALYYWSLYGGVGVDKPYDVSMPANPDIDRKATEELLASACLNCHAFSGLQSGGGFRAPPLSLARERLRRNWVEQFIVDAPAAMPGSGVYPRVVMPIPPFAQPGLDEMSTPAPLHHAIRPGTPEYKDYRQLMDFLYLEHPLAPSPTTQPSGP
ncbi:MAG: hypothetical protein BIFFINMI_04009 [Phycisphaerae bacterium]|nr:hypothetical protein [Phycisphaerae bacterium]